jgi:hypothetical protein
MEKMRSAYKVLVWKPGGKRPIWEDNTGTAVK